MSRHPFVVRKTTRRASCEPGPVHLSIHIVIVPITRSQTRNAALAPCQEWTRWARGRIS